MRSWGGSRVTQVVVATAWVALLAAGCGGDTYTPTEQATEFWEAVSTGDREAAAAEVDPSALTAGDVNTFGRAATLEDQFDWYEAVDWEWALEGCVEDESGSIVCTVTARNAWSDVLGVEPVEGTFEMMVGETGIIGITDEGDGFINSWSPFVFEVFANWVIANHQADAAVMFDFSVDVNDEILDLYRINTERFVDEYLG